MKILHGLLAVILLFFAVLQINDPDAVIWFSIYVVAALWPGLAAFKPELLTRQKPLRLFGLAAIALCAVGFVANAGTISADWIHVETAREAFGYVICAVAIGIALYSTRPVGGTSLA